MPDTTYPTADGNVATAPFSLDEGALHALFTAQFDILRRRAVAQLGEFGELAPKVVENAFVGAWRHRTQFGSADDLLAYLQEEVDHGSLRTLSRRTAAHRLATQGRDLTVEARHANGVVPNEPEVVWSHVTSAIQNLEHGHGREEFAAKAHHDAVAHIASAAKTTNWPLIIGLFLLTVLVVGGGAYLLERAGDKAMVAKAVDGQGVEIVGTMPTQAAKASLADGSEALIGADSRIKIPKIFNTEARAIRAEGLVRLNVKPAELPFQLFVGRAVVTVTGTVLTVRAYPEDSSAYVTLQEGRATVAVGPDVRDLTPGTGVFVPATGAVRSASAAEIAEVTSWTRDTIVVENRSLRLALVEVRRWFGNAIVADSALLDRRVSFRAPVGQVRDAITQIEASGKLKFGYVENAMVFEDAGAPPKK
ncbi:MAG: FecR domain-containing protein [Gemmatimonadaceae bacterium]